MNLYEYFLVPVFFGLKKFLLINYFQFLCLSNVFFFFFTNF